VAFLELVLTGELERKDERRVTTMLKLSGLPPGKTFEGFDFGFQPRVDRRRIEALATCSYIREKTNVLFLGPPGTGKTFVACALGHAACRHGFTVRYLRLPRLLGELAVARSDGSYGKLMQTLARTDLLVLDDWGLAPLGDRERRDLLEVIEDRTGRRATLVTSQLPVDHWHELVGDPTFGDAILDRLVHHAHRITLTGGSLRRLTTDVPPTTTDD